MLTPRLQAAIDDMLGRIPISMPYIIQQLAGRMAFHMDDDPVLLAARDYKEHVTALLAEIGALRRQLLEAKAEAHQLATILYHDALEDREDLRQVYLRGLLDGKDTTIFDAVCQHLGVPQHVLVGDGPAALPQIVHLTPSQLAVSTPLPPELLAPDSE